MERADDINARRVALWDRYYDALAPLEAAGGVRRARVPAECRHNGHIFFLIFDDLDLRMKAREALSAHEISSSAHYVPLHSSPGGQRFGRTASDMKVTDAVHDGLLRLPAYAHMTMDEQDRVIETLLSLRG
jgi:dTDP-4-amino-4,6-dideoxygalactose transaminase